MNLFEKILYQLQVTMEKPEAFGWFHLLWIILIFIVLFTLHRFKNNYSPHQLKWVLAIYGIGSLVLEILKQLIWSFNYDSATLISSWDYQWYAFPFQFCTTPIYVSIICLFLKKGTIRDSLLSYLALYTILGSFMTVIIPDNCFVEDVLVNIHTMYLHCGSLVVSLYLLMSGEVKLEIKSLIRGFIVFLLFVYIAQMLNIIMYNSKIISSETFNMFYISPYFESELPVFNVLQQHLPYLIYLITYILAIFLGSLIVYFLAKIIKDKKGSIILK